MKVLVTGGEGFVGQNIVNKLIDDGHNVSIVVSGGSDNINPKVNKIFRTSMAGISFTEIVKWNPDAIIHMMANNDTLCNSEYDMYQTNVAASKNIFYISEICKCKYFIWASTTAVYGNQAAPFKEDHTPLLPLNIYGETKLDFDAFCKMQMLKKPLVKNMVGLRFCNVYGPGEDHKNKRMSMIGQILRQVIKNQTPKLFKDGTQKRDWVHVYDIADLCSSLLSKEDVKSGIYNIANGKSISFNEIIDIIQDVCNTNITVDYIECNFMDKFQTNTECDISNAKRELGFDPKFSIRSGIEQYYKKLIEK